MRIERHAPWKVQSQLERAASLFDLSADLIIRILFFVKEMGQSKRNAARKGVSEKARREAAAANSPSSKICALFITWIEDGATTCSAQGHPARRQRVRARTDSPSIILVAFTKMTSF
jgi:hypothetical protein